MSHKIHEEYELGKVESLAEVIESFMELEGFDIDLLHGAIQLALEPEEVKKLTEYLNAS